MSILIVGNVLKDVYLNLDSRSEHLETDKHGTQWLDLSFNASQHHFYNRSSNLGGATVSLEVLTNLGLEASINGSSLHFTADGLINNQPTETYRYIMLADDKPCYLVPTSYRTTHFTPPAESYDYLYIDRSAELDQTAASRIVTYLEISQNTKLILYLKNLSNPHLNGLIPYASLLFLEEANQLSTSKGIIPADIENSDKLIHISDHRLTCQNISEPISIERIDMLTHLSIYSIISATVLGSFILGYSIEDSFRLARINIENSKLNASLSLEQLQSLDLDTPTPNNLELIASSLVLHPKGILAADESGGSIHKKFEQLNIPDTYDNRRDYRNIFFTTDGLEDHVNGVILFDETARQIADNGQNFVEYLTSKRLIPGIKVDQGLAPLSPGSLETITNGLDGLEHRLTEYYQMGLRFAKWRAAFELRVNHQGHILTPTETAITANCHALAKYASLCQKAGLVPIVEPEVVYDGYYSIDQSASVTGNILRALFAALQEANVNLKACILKVNMILAGKQYETQSTPAEVGKYTAEILKANVPDDLAGIVFLSGGQTVEQATDNLTAIIKNGPFPWPVTFSFARALQDPALYAWKGDNTNADTARQAFLERLQANTSALKQAKTNQ
ncbi:fructose-bisphosphate aldolase class I [Candidatus Saccharibacteria bacterium]|nr:fructose-bisphosphate aldolase class I [Candidatus Saccharibacteria bacterium]